MSLGSLRFLTKCYNLTLMYSPKLDVLNLLQQPTYQPGTEKSKDAYYSCLTYNRTVDVSDYQKHAKIPRLDFNVFAAVQLLLLIRACLGNGLLELD